ncbi:hypothetical protein ACFV06_31480 [Streptomyces sp. NPDC059618]|uniref:hypothetical protein n=1 Tax=Streptomyces sp. NPDC059618 TaxID=3346887 RepID=UPI00368F502F
MAGSFRIAEGYVEVTADESNYDRAMDRLRSKKTTVKIGLELDDREAITKLDRLLRERVLGVKINLDETALARLKLKDVTVSVVPKISDAAYNRVKSQLDRLTKERTVNIRASVDARVAADEIRNLTARRQVRIGIDVDTRVAADSLANLTRRRDMTVGVNLNDGAARTRLDALTRPRTVNIRADVDRSATSRIGSMFSGSMSGAFSAIKGSLTSIVGLAIQALPTLASLGTSIAAMAPAAAISVPAILGLGAAFAALKLGMSGIGAGFKQAFAPATSSGNAAASSTRRVEDAQRSLAKAQQAVKDAEVNAAQARVQAARQIADAQQNLKNTVSDVAEANRRAIESVESAERDLADAQRAAKQAQQDLTQARKDAAQELEDLNARLADAQLDQRQKVLDLQDAEQNLAAVKAKGAAASAEDLAKAQLQYDKAVQALAEQQTETARLQEQTDTANAAGVEGSKTVTDAKQKISDANQDVTDKTRALKDAETEQTRTAQDNAQKLAKAERDVADAREAARKAAVDGARQVADAEQSVADAARNVADAQTAGAAATAKTADALAKLAPNARSFVAAVVAQREAWRGLKLDVQNRLFAGLGQKFTTMSGAILPSLHSGLTGAAGVLNQMAKGAFDAVTNLGKTGQLRKLFDGLNDGMKPLAKAPGQFITGLTQIGIAAAPAFKRVTTATGGVFDRISKQIGAAAKNGHLEKVIDHALDIAVQFGHVIGDVFGTLGNVMKAASAAGGDALGGLGAVFKELRKITAMPEVQAALKSIFTAVNSIAKLVAGTLGAVIKAALPLLAALAPVVTELATKFGPVLAQLAGALGKALMPIIGALLPIVGDLGNLLISLVKSVMPLLKPIGDLLGVVIKALAPFIKMFGDNLKIIVGALVQGLAPIITALIPAVGMFGQLFAQITPLFPPLYQAIAPLLPQLGTLVAAMLNLAMQVITPLMPLIVSLAQILTGVLAAAIGVLVPVISTVIGWLTTWNNAVASVVKAIVGAFTWLFDVLVGHSIIPDLVHAIVGWFTKLWTETKRIFNELKTWVVSLWNNLWTTVRTRWNSFWSGISTAIGNAWKSFRDSLTGLKTSLTNTWNSLWIGIANKIGSTFSTINGKITSFKNGMKTAFSTLRDSLGTIWNGVRSKISAPIKWVIDTVYNNGIRRMWNSIAGKISSSITLPAISLGFNQGGVVPGTGNSDTVPAMLTPGERILSNTQVAALGGHRGIDAMLGKDRPTRTGGNPSRQQERQREQGGQQHYSSGGIIGKVTSGIGDTISGAYHWAKDVVVGGLREAAEKALHALVRPLINQIPGSGVGNLMRGLVNKGVDGMLGWFGKEDKKAVGGPAVQRALSWVKSQDGKPYQWAGNGNPSWDCSGLMSAIESVIRGQKPHRRWATGAFGSSAPSGWVRNLNSPFMIGITNAGVGHTAGTLAGMNVESSGGRGVHMGKTARGYNDSLFTSRWGFAPAAKYDSGGLLQPGATMAINKTRKPEAVLTAEEHDAFRSIVRSGGSVVIENITVSGTFDFSAPSSQKLAAKQLVTAMKEELRKYDNSRRR